MLSNCQATELFHLYFLSCLGTKVHKNLFQIKGGCNLRFFFRSIRYSEDLDLDVQVIAKETLRKNVNQILSSQSLRHLLSEKSIEIVGISEPRQTEITQRWKLRLKTRDGQELPTKIECSRRSVKDKEISLEPINNSIQQFYQLKPLLLPHYTLSTAFRQKIEALAGRAETQARDIFDLKLLLDAGAVVRKIHEMEKACENAVNITFEMYRGQVVAFLEPEYQGFYGSVETWRSMQKSVVAALKEGKIK